MRVWLAILLGGISVALSAQSFTSFFTGDTADFQSDNILPGIVLAGGGPDVDAAMRWMLARAGGGDVVVLRASQSDGYNDYFFSELGVEVNSVETIRFNHSIAAQQPYVIRRIREAEVLFIAGGNQTDYVDYWRESPVAEAINFLLNEKQITVGGTSAGMAVLGGAYYAPENGSLTSEQALSDPYHPNTEGFSIQPFLHTPFLENVITDTHFEGRNRQGRSMVFLARAQAELGQPALVIACNDATAVCIDGNGMAQVFGSYPDFPDYAWFLQAGCLDDTNGPESLEAGVPFSWHQNGRAVSGYRLPGDAAGSRQFDVNNWQDQSNPDEFWQDWAVQEGQISFTSPGSPPANCAISSVASPAFPDTRLGPSPTQGHLSLVEAPAGLSTIKLYDLHGQCLQTFSPTARQFDLSEFPSGIYLFRIIDQRGRSQSWKIVRD